MSNPVESPSPLVRFLDGFLQEQNIKWILAAGVAILLGSSVMMVTSHWDSIGETWKYMILLGYVGVIHGAGQWCYHCFVLHKTGSVLMALTVLLLPLSFVAWHLFVYKTCVDHLSGVAGVAVALGLLIPNILLALGAARRIFAHFLKGTQPTFLVSYLLLGLAGAFAPAVAAMGSVAAVVMSLAMWAVFLAGSVKVNRHVFWLTEEHNAPRVCGFLPVLLLGGQFLGVFAANFVGAFSTAWLGFGLVLVAIPVLLAADAVASVFQQRTGNLVRPFPWPVALPLTLGTFLCAAGVVLACTQMFVLPHLPYALVPTAALAAVVMTIVARRTEQKFFVWLALAGVLVAYNFSPVFFIEVARQVVGMAADAVREERLPYAFYGLTYLPLIGAFTAGAVAFARRGYELFAEPLRQLSIALAGLLLLASFTHPALTLYPVFLVGLVMTGVFALQAWLYRDRRLAWAAVVSWLAATTGSASFLHQVFGVTLVEGAELYGPLFGATVLLVVGRWLDPRIALLSRVERDDEGNVERTQYSATCQVSSLVATLGVAVAWLLMYFLPSTGEHAWAAAAMIAGLLFVHCLRWLHTVLTAATYGFCVAVAVCATVAWQVEWQTAATMATGVLLAQWLLDYLFTLWPTTRIARAFAVVNRYTSYAGLAALMGLVYLPLLTIELALPSERFGLSRALFLFATVWAFDAARRSRRAAFAVAGFVAVLLLAAGAWLDVAAMLDMSLGTAYQWLPCLWAATALAAVPVVEWLRRRPPAAVGFASHHQRNGWNEISVTMNGLVRLVLEAIAILSLMGLDWPLRIAGVVAVAGLLAIARCRRDVVLRTHASVLVNWHAIAAVVALAAPSLAGSWFALLGTGGTAVLLPLAFAAAASAVVWQVVVTRYLSCDADYVHVHTLVCQLLAGLMLIASLALPHLTDIDFLLAGATFTLMALNECRVALRDRSEGRAWLAEVVAGLAVAYFAWFHVISFGRGISMFVVLGVGLLSHVAAHVVTGRSRWWVFRSPLLALSLSLPMVSVVIATARHFIYADPGSDPAWFGMNSLAMLLAAAFYFWQGLETDESADAKRTGLFLLSAGIVNAALALLWIDLQWTDPQLFLVPIGMSMLLLVEILRREIPDKFHNPLRYAGALVVLVSPTFDIVGGSWVHLFSLMVLSVVVLLLGIGVRVRVLVYAGAAFLCADLVAMVVRGSIDNPNLLWVAGIACGAAVLALGAFCENNREVLLQRMRALSSELETWN